jgi:hypothetical protein
VGLGPLSGSSDLLATLEATTPLPPGQPRCSVEEVTPLGACNSTRSSVLSWTSPPDAGGARITVYVASFIAIGAGPLSVTTYLPALQPSNLNGMSPLQNEKLIQRLLSANVYVLQVYACSTAGCSSPSEASPPLLLPPMRPPQYPSMLRMVHDGEDESKLQW